MATAAGAAGHRAPLRVAFASRELRRCHLALTTSRIADAATLVAVSVHLFGRSGAAAVAIFGVVRTLVPAVGTPVVTAFAGRASPGTALAACLGTTGVAWGAATAVVLTDGPDALLLVLAGLAGVAATAVRPLVVALLPAFIQGPAALVATNVAAALLENVSAFVGPVAAGVALATLGPVWVLAGTATLLVLAAVVVLGIDSGAGPVAAGATDLHWAREVVDGVRTMWREQRLRLAVGCGMAQVFVRAGLNVLVVALAIDRLALGEGGVGVLLGAIGVGGLVGLPIAARGVGGGRMARALGVGLTLWGLPVMATGLVSDRYLAMLLFALMGVGNTLVDISVSTLFQRLAPPGTLARALGAFESVLFVGMALGAVAAERLLDVAGLSTGLVVLGALLPLLAAGSWRALGRIDGVLRRRDDDVALFQLHGIFSPLVLTTIDRIASRAETHHHDAGDTIVRAGDEGHHYYLLEEGEVDVLLGDRVVGTLGPGDGFGELALLEDTTRTATVVATTPARTRSLHRDDFLSVLDTHEDARGAALELAARRERE